MSSQNVSRRRFLGASAAVMGSGLALAVPSEAKVTGPVKFDETFDVIVIGSGFAGLCAAYEAAKAGCRVVVLEKMPTFGGNSIINGGEMTCVGSPQQKAAGFKDSVDLWIHDTVTAGLGLNHMEKIKVLGENMLKNYYWLKDEIGVRFKDICTQDGGHSVPRSVLAENGSGSGFVNPLLAKCREKNVVLRNRCYVETIWRDPETGRVTGLKVREGYRFPKEGSGKPKWIRAVKGVVCCYGGFGADVKYRTMQDPKLTDKFDITNQRGATAELWHETARIGAQQILNDWIQVVPWTSPDEKGMGISWQFSQTCAAPYGIWLDTTTGRRFVNELQNRKVRADAIMNLGNKGHKCIAITDVRGARQLEKNRPGVKDTMLQRKCLFEFKTLEDLCRHFNMPLKPVQEELAYVNDLLRRHQKSDKFGKLFAPDSTVIENGPWYAANLLPKIHHCMGGLLTNGRGQVLDCSDEKPIPGLYAAGESTGGVHGAVRLGCNAILDCCVNGRIAGENVAREA